MVGGDSADQERLRSFLVPEGHHLKVLTDAADVSSWEAAKYDLVVLDLAGPGCLELVGGLRAQEKALSKGIEVPVLGLDGTAGETQRSGYLAGISGYLHRPLDEEEVKATVRGLSVIAGPAFDAHIALANLGHPSIVKEIVSVFLVEAPSLFEEVRAAHQSGSLPELARAGHRFAGGIAVFGDIPCVRAARGLERAAETAGPASEYFRLLDQTFARLYATLQAC